MNLASVKQFLTITFLVIVVALIGASFMNAPGLIYVMMAFFVIYAVVFLVGWRCPKCKAHLGKLNARRCRKCGQELFRY